MLDQAQIQAIFEYAHILGHLDYFSPTYRKLYFLVADDRDWQPGELSAANRWLADVAHLDCPLSGKRKKTDDLDCIASCPWSACDIREVSA